MNHLTILFSLQLAVSTSFMIPHAPLNGMFGVSPLMESKQIQPSLIKTRDQHAIIPRKQSARCDIRLQPTVSRTIASDQISLRTALSMVWWYGGSENVDEKSPDDDSCELVAVRIERTSPNSRRIFGEITVPAPMSSVWSILTDYDNLSTHVPNLVESRIVQRNVGVNGGGRQGDGQYQCRLFQKGAQKIIGFEFGASVTMDMKEKVAVSADGSSLVWKILFKCYDSFFFQEFDGEWSVVERRNPTTGDVETMLSYVVDVRPKGPVPVAALEWRIREDVPTNLRAVKKAAIMTRKSVAPSDDVILRSLEVSRQATNIRSNKPVTRVNRNNKYTGKGSPTFQRDTRVRVQWYKDETMAAYLND